MTDYIVVNGRQCSPTVQSRLEAADARIKEIEEQLSRASEPLPIFSLSPDEIKESILTKLRDLQGVLTQAAGRTLAPRRVAHALQHQLNFHSPPAPATSAASFSSALEQNERNDAPLSRSCAGGRSKGVSFPPRHSFEGTGGRAKKVRPR